MRDEKHLMSARSEDVFFDALGEHAALLTHRMDCWFEHIVARLDALESRVDAPLRPVSPQIEGLAAAPVAPNAQPASSAPVPELPTAAVAEPLPELKLEALAAYDLRNTWQGWRFHQATKMKPNGVVEFRQDRSTPGVQSESIALTHGGLFRIVIDSSYKKDRASFQLILRVVDEREARLGPDFELAPGTGEFFLFAGRRVQALRLLVMAINPKIGLEFSLNRVEVAAVDPESYFERRRRQSLGPVIASMATIPARRVMLEDCVASLLLQCDLVRVFLNGYPDVPDYLNHPRVEVRRSQDWDDKGDAGKFAWVEQTEPAGYRIIVDDDLVFPPDFAERMSGFVHARNDTAIYAMHGVLLKQPVVNYYEPESRSVFHFQNALKHERTCHVLGTNALCYHSKAVRMSWADFMFRNMADIFLAQYAQRHALPMVTPARAPYWVRQNSQDGGFETIYENSLKKSKSKFDSSVVQDALVKWSFPLTLQPTTRLKVAFILIGFEGAVFRAALETCERTFWADYDWAIILVNGEGSADMQKAIKIAKAAYEIHVLDEAGSSGSENLARAFALAQEIDFDVLCVATDRIRFQKGIWMRSAAGLATSKKRGTIFVAPTGQADATEAGPNLRGEWVPVLTITSRDAVREIKNPNPRMPSGLSSLSAWLRTLSANGSASSVQIKDLSSVSDAIRVDPEAPRLKLVRPREQSLDPLSPPQFVGVQRSPALAFNDFFAKVFVINLDRRPDRWDRVKRRLDRAGLKGERYPAEDGSADEHSAAFKAYNESPLVTAGGGTRRIETSKQFYQDYDSEAARVAYVEQRDRKKAIRSAGAWGYLKTWERILERVLEERIATTLVLDDDVVFHKLADVLFAASVAGLPDEWLIFQLGTLQHHWSPDWITWQSRFLYRTNGSAIGSHAVGLKFEVAPFLLEHVKRMLLPFDTGALAMATRAFAERCFVAYPNIAIQSLEEISDIATSEFQRAGDYTKVAETYRWDLASYIT